MNRWYMYNPESVLKNETNKILWDFYFKRIPYSRPEDHTK